MGLAAGGGSGTDLVVLECFFDGLLMLFDDLFDFGVVRIELIELIL